MESVIQQVSNKTLINENELESKREEDAEWIQVKEESLLLNEALIAYYYDELENQKEEVSKDETLGSELAKEDRKIQVFI